MVQPLINRQQYKALLFVRGLLRPGIYTLSGEATEEFTHKWQCFCIYNSLGR